MKVCVGEGYEGLGFSLVRVDGAHPLSVMVVAVSPRVRMVLRVGRCVEFMGVWLSGHFGQCITLLYRVWVVAWLILLR